MIKSGITLSLSMGTGQIGTVGCSKMTEKTLGIKPRHLRDFGTQVSIRLCNLKTDATHACIHGKVEGSGFAQFLRGFGKSQCIFIAENCRTDVVTDGGRKSGRGCVPQN